MTSQTEFRNEWLSALPEGVLVLVCSRLAPADLCHLSETCKWLRDAVNNMDEVWRSKVPAAVLDQPAIAETSASDSVPNRSLVRKLASEHVVIGTMAYRIHAGTGDVSVRESVFGLYVVWLNDYYLVERHSADSPFGKVVYVDNVCWLDVCGRIRGVPPGRYVVRWRVKLHGRSFELEDLLFKACAVRSDLQVDLDADENAPVSFRWSVDAQRDAAEAARRAPFFLSCGEVTVGPDSDVEVLMKNHSSWWKRGLSLDYVELAPVLADAGPWTPSTPLPFQAASPTSSQASPTSSQTSPGYSPVSPSYSPTSPSYTPASFFYAGSGDGSDEDEEMDEAEDEDEARPLGQYGTPTGLPLVWPPQSEAQMAMARRVVEQMHDYEEYDGDEADEEHDPVDDVYADSRHGGIAADDPSTGGTDGSGEHLVAPADCVGGTSGHVAASGSAMHQISCAAGVVGAVMSQLDADEDEADVDEEELHARQNEGDYPSFDL